MINQDVAVAVRANEPMKYFVYQIVGRGDIITTHAVQVISLFTYSIYRYKIE